MFLLTDGLMLRNADFKEFELDATPCRVSSYHF